MKKILGKWFNSLGLNVENPDLWISVIHMVVVIVFCLILYWVIKSIMLNVIHKISERTKSTWDDELVKSHFFKKLAVLPPLIFISNSFQTVFSQYEEFHVFVEKALFIIIVLSFAAVIMAFINALQRIVETKPGMKGKPLHSYSQLLKILVYFVLGLWMFSIVTGKTPMFFLTAMGAMSAVVLLVFKDTILGFVGSIQLATNDMVRIGDWITMERYGADGNVVEINLATIKVQNFDKTITTIPTYSLISDSFKNWRGMEESDGRRMKRSVNIKIGSVHFCHEEMMKEFKGIKLLESYISEKEVELSAFNKSNHFDPNDINGRRLTNIGVFRKYVELYLQNHHLVNKDLTCMVRQLSPSENGLPIEVYAFSKDKDWVKYEQIMADIFDHLLAVIPSFHLEVFQAPTGSDFAEGFKS